MVALLSSVIGFKNQPLESKQELAQTHKLSAVKTKAHIQNHPSFWILDHHVDKKE
jgi:hypothetical protein